MQNSSLSGKRTKEPSVVAQSAVFGDFEAQLLGVELERLVLIVYEQFDKRDSFHEHFSFPPVG
jgi:hypothetical protein